MPAHRVFANVDPGNIASIRVFEKLGFPREGQLRSTEHALIFAFRDPVIFGLMATDPRHMRTSHGS